MATPETSTESTLSLTWSNHLLRREPQRLPLLVATFCFAAICVWLLFGRPLPVLAALGLLVSATGEYLFPQQFRLTSTGAYADGPMSRLAIRWEDVRRCVPTRRGVLLTSLPAPSRLDSFRGVYLRFAPAGEPGDRASVLAVLAHHKQDCASIIDTSTAMPGGSHVGT